MRRVIRLACALVCVGSGVSADARPYRDGDVVVFFGDSITHGGLYHAYLTDFYRTRYPDADIRFVNSGIGGDTAAGAFKRIPEDVTEYAPTHVAFHFGMNDVARWAYLAETTPDALRAREQAQVDYRASFGRLVAAVRRAVPAAAFTYLTPTHYDDTAVVTNAPPNLTGWASVNQVGCNVGLSLMAGYVLTAAKRDGAMAIDWYSPMNNFLMRRRAKDPHFMTTRYDRVHPGPLGHSLMAWQFLKAQGVDPVVSAVSVDAANGCVLAATNAVVDKFERSDAGIAFDMKARALPFPVPREAMPYLAEQDVESRLNLEVVTVKGLAAGRYRLRIDGEEVGCYDAAELDGGVRLGFNQKTPQYRQAQAVFARVEELRKREAVLRSHHSARWFYAGRAPVDDVSAFAAWFEKNEPNKNDYFASFVPGYLKYWPTYRETRAALWADQRAVRALAAPARRHYEIVRDAAPKWISAFNLDSTNFTATHGDAEMNAAGVRAFLDSIIGQGAFTHFFICPNAQTALFDTKTLSPSWWRTLEKGKPAEVCPRRDYMLFTNGVDVVQVYVDGCRAKGVSPWLSMRMNDSHCPDKPDWWGHSKFWVEHPEYRQEGGFSLAHPEVRAVHLAFVRELLERYDTDGFECDWMRWPLKQHAEDLTAMMREVRKLADAASRRRGHPVLVGVRVASRPERAKELGMDVAVWTKEGLVDWVSPCNFFASVDFELPVGEWKTLVANGPRAVRVIPGADSGVAANDLVTGKPVWRRLMTLAEYREWADRMHRRGAEGICLFNLFTFLEPAYKAPSLEPWNVIRAEGLSPAAVAGKEKRFPEGWRYER